MPFRRNLRPIMSDKHEITWSNLIQDASSAITITLAKGVATADRNTASEVVNGSRINSIYFEFHFSANVVTNPKVIHWQIAFKPEVGGLSTPITYYNDDRAYIFKRGMEMLPKDAATVFKRVFVIKVPRIYQRMKMGGQLQLTYICSSTEAINACGFAIYKNYQ